MKKINISISYDEEKVKALNLYLEQRDIKLEDELLKAVDALYTKIVPSNVREFIDLRSGAPAAPPKKKPRSAPSAVVASGPMSALQAAAGGEND